MVAITALSAILHDGETYAEGDSLEVTADEAAALVEAQVASTGRQAQEAEVVAPKPPTIKEKIEAAEAEGLTLDVTGLRTHAEIDAAIEAARTPEVEEPVVEVQTETPTEPPVVTE
ncbi:hypothetical protein E3O44_12645 [Cryobacterium algoricola]|uniref:DUF7210 domain-containing protein n=1 Tax=Cryobacterium algoricola TaxID=1259183 RepID=A0ABY2ICH6_9MICO|nr:hypothetical protein [Cryobacterium algoricola]TFB85844.1 hypothetical protein E3O44_12645 [Cryobacterium algoricola]